ncbi:MAG: FAD-dependent oxidoreductase [Coriobacteriales bacterium]|jgi:2,4-dienoyl-CoA reductase-like NADH-dependent reductase (Old Yellow Enzyme family)|nr:FAD-dependent oxidoreductase [Coriobacteriales bacterium]
MSTENKTLTEGLTRRGFLKGAALGTLAAGVAGAGLVACTPTPSTPTGGDKPVGGGGAAGALNPQDYNYTSNSITDFASAALFTPWQIGPHTIPNRMVKSAAFQLAFMRNIPDEYITYYKRMAEGGVGMVWIEDCANLWDFTASPMKQPFENYDWPGLLSALHDAGAKVGYQFDTMGSPVGPLTWGQNFLGQYTIEDIQSWKDAIIGIGKTLKETGFDAYELNFAANNLGQSFFCRARNDRTDEYGPQTIESRTKFMVEVITGIKEACGQDFVVQLLINGVEENDNILGESMHYTSIEETKAIAKIAQDAGADSIHLRLGPSGTHVAQFASELYFAPRGLEGQSSFGSRYDFSKHFGGLTRAKHSGCGINLDIAAAVKEAVTIPVGCATYNDPAQAPDYFEAAVSEGKVDFLVMNRPLCVDPGYVNKLKEGKLDEIAPCTRCLHCFYDADLHGTALMEHCRVNAANWRSYGEVMPEGYAPLPATGDKKVMVIGGGPAGCEAARIAAQRGYSVTLYEKGAALGGMLSSAEAIKGPHENLNRLAAYFTKQQELSGVTVVTGQEVDADFVKAEAPDVVILAAGGTRTSLGLASSGSTTVYDFASFLGADLGQKVVVWGGNCQAVDVAVYLAGEGYKVDIVAPDDYVVAGMFGMPPGTDPLKVFDKGHSANMREFLLPALTATGTQIWTGATIDAVGDGSIEITTDVGLKQTILADSVVDVSDLLPNKGLLDGLSGIETYAVGDCDTPYNIAEAIAAGNLTARKI